MWKFLWRALAVLPREITLVFATAFCMMAVVGLCLALVDFAPGGAVPDALLAIAGYVAGIKLIITVTAITASIPLAFGMLIGLLARRIFPGTRNKP